MLIKLVKKILPSSTKHCIRDYLLKSISPERDKLVGMTSRGEQLWYTQIAKELSRQDGAIVDLGSWMGSTAISLGRGLSETMDPKEGVKPVFALDRYIWESWMDSYMSLLTCDYLPGDSFLPEVRRRFSLSGENIIPIQADLSKYLWKGGEIVILLVDAMKSPELCIAISKEFYPKLNEGSVLIHQDYKHFYTPWIHLLQYRLRDYFLFLHEVYGSGTAAFKVIKQLPLSVIEEAAKVNEVTDQEMSEAIQYSMTLIGREGKPNIAAAHVMHFLHANRVDEASNVFNSYLVTFDKVGDLARIEKIITKKSG